MYVLRIEHPVPSYEGWRVAFDSDPVGRERLGVRRYQVLRPADDPNYIMIDLEFDSKGEAETFLAALRELWGRVEGTVLRNPQARIVEKIESKEF